MAETKEKKGFNAALYAVVAGIVVAVALVLITIFAFTTRYTGFSNEKVAQAYVDTIVQTGDGYNAYKNTLVSKNQKFGKFVTNAYMRPYINEDAKASFVGTGTDEEIAKQTKFTIQCMTTMLIFFKNTALTISTLCSTITLLS